MKELTKGLDELFSYKNQLMNDLLTSETIVKLLSEDGATLADPETLIYNQVYPYEYIPDVQEHGKTFICCEVDIGSVNGKTFLNPRIYLWVFTHKSKLRLPGGGLRVDRLTSEIVETLNGSRLYSLGELNLKNVRRFSPIVDYQGRTLEFTGRDWNRINPTGKPVPANRKVGIE